MSAIIKRSVVYIWGLTIFINLFIGGLNDSYGAKKNVKARRISGEMILIPSGKYVPFLKDKNGIKPVQIKSFYLDAFPVTNKEFLEFVKANPKWQRSKVRSIFADASYLSQWKSDMELGPDAEENSPVTNVSWFAASAYAEWKGKRLPTLSEWEYAASASDNNPDGRQQESFKKQILKWYSKPSGDQIGSVGKSRPNYYGVYDMHGLVWEWIDDFNSVLISGGGGNSGDQNFFCGSGSTGTADPGDYAAFMRFAMRSSLKANYTVYNLGFRCARDISK